MALSEEQLAKLMETAREQLSSNDYVSAEENFKKVMQESPLYPMSYLGCATARYFQNKHSEAIMSLDTAIALLPKSDELNMAYHNRALAYITLNKLSDSVNDLKIAVGLGFKDSQEELDKVTKVLDPKDIPTQEELAVSSKAFCEEAKKVFSKNPLYGLVLFNKAVDFDPTSVNAMYGEGLANSMLGRVDPALESFNAILEGASDENLELRAEVLLNRAPLLNEKNEVEQSISDLAECLSLALDENVKFPALGSVEQESAMIEKIQAKIDEWKKEISIH